jgi:murein DD-endopeptidase MepM/ murein hydrolase activator NlpD
VAGRFELSRAKIPAKLVFCALAVIPIAACSSPNIAPYTSPVLEARPLSHMVQRGETIYCIARTYGVSPASLMAANGLSDPRKLLAGQILIIPAYRRSSALGLSSPWPVVRADRQFAWPVTAGLISSPFGMRNGVMHDGIDIAAGIGTAVRAADDGTVIFAGRLHGYGNAVILQHSAGYVTVYGHNERNLVRYGAEVVRGEVIAELGSSGRTTGPNLHFEVRFQGQPQNPLAYLPQPSPNGGISFARNGGS